MCHLSLGCQHKIQLLCRLFLKRCNVISGTLKSDPIFRGKRCTWLSRPVDNQSQREGRKIMLGRRLWPRRHHKAPFNRPLPKCPSSPPAHPHHLQRKTLHLHASGIWAPTSDLHNLQRNDRAIIRCACGVTTKEQVSSQDLLYRMKLDDLKKVSLTRRLRWHNHVERCHSWLKAEVQKLNPVGGCDSGRPKKTWSEVIRLDRLALGLTWTLPSEGNLGALHLCRQTGLWIN